MATGPDIFSQETRKIIDKALYVFTWKCPSCHTYSSVDEWGKVKGNGRQCPKCGDVYDRMGDTGILVSGYHR